MFSNPYSFVQRTFPPMVGCLSSPTVEQICQKNNLSFVDMLRPFCNLNVEHRLRDPAGNDHLIKNLQVFIQDVNDKPMQPALAKKLLNESVSSAQCEATKEIVTNNATLNIPIDCKWFHSWCQTFLLVQYPSDHEFTTHLLGCLIVTSTIDPPETFQLLLQSLQQMQTVSPSKLPKWFSPNVFKFYVLVHDVKDGDKEKALEFFSSLKSAYGKDQCFFLEINSQYHLTPSTVIHDYWVNYVSHRNLESDGSDYESNPRTPAEINSLGGMPNTLVSELDNVVRPGGSPEVAQEAKETQQPVIIHPLSPDLEAMPFSAVNENQTHFSDSQRVVNSDVWTSLPNSYQYGNFLTPSDVANIKNLIKHLVIYVLIPHVEKLIFQLNDLTSNKKGVSRSLLSATKRLFGTSKAGSPGGALQNSVVYTNDAPELQLRRLGDLYFMLTHYSLAFQAYHSVKRDFASDQAHIYLAGALEMAALSAFMQGDMGRKVMEYMEEAILIYMNSCKLPQFATRATLLSMQFLKDRERFGEAAKQLIRMTSEDSDLRSALLLEQASYCFLYSNKPNMSRKYAFHMVLAGHRFSKAGQRKHAFRCYSQAFQVYQNKNWNLAEDHIHFTMGRLAGQLKLLKESSASLSSLLTSGGKQTPGQQITYLMEYLQILQQLHNKETSKEVNSLRLPVIEDNCVRVLVSTSSNANLTNEFEPATQNDFARWARMEELAVTESQGTPMIFRPTLNLFAENTNNSISPTVVVQENIYVQVSLKNPLQITVPLLRVRLLWAFYKNDGEVVSNDGDDDFRNYIETNVLESVHLNPLCSEKIILRIKPLCSGRVEILGMRYMLTCPAGSKQPSNTPIVPGKQLFVVRGPKAKLRKEQNAWTVYEDDNRLKINIIEALPFLQVDAEDLIADMLCGEIGKTVLKLKNSGNAPLKNLYLVTSSPQFFTMPNENVIGEKIISDGANQEYEETLKRESHIYKVIKIKLPKDEVLNAGEDVTLPLWIRAPDWRGCATIDILFYYENLPDVSALRYRISRFSRKMLVHDSLQLSAMVTRSKLCEDKDTMTIALSVNNLSEQRNLLGVLSIYLVQISLATPKWELQKKVVSSEDLRLNSQETYSCVIRAIRSSSASSEITDVCLQEEKVDPGLMQPYYDFYKWHDYDEKDIDCDNLYKMVLCLRWKGNISYSEGTTKYFDGQSHVKLTDLAVPSMWPAETANYSVSSEQVVGLRIFGPGRKLTNDKNFWKGVQLENALSYNLLYEQKVQHCFRERRICRVEMKLVLRNCIDCPLSVKINMPGVKYVRQSVTRTQLYTPHSSSTFNWASRSNALIKLTGNQKSTISLAAVFTSPGTYDLGSRLTVSAARLNDTDFTLQLCSVESSIMIFELQPEKY